MFCTKIFLHPFGSSALLLQTSHDKNNFMFYFITLYQQPVKRGESERKSAWRRKRKSFSFLNIFTRNAVKKVGTAARSKICAQRLENCFSAQDRAFRSFFFRCGDRNWNETISTLFTLSPSSSYGNKILKLFKAIWHFFTLRCSRVAFKAPRSDNRSWSAFIEASLIFLLPFQFSFRVSISLFAGEGEKAFVG